MSWLRNPLPRHWSASISPGLAVLGAIAAISTAYVLFRPVDKHDGLELWTFARQHYESYGPIVDEWNVEHPQAAVRASLLDGRALERRMMSAFLSGTPIADLIEAETQMAARSFAGPLDSVGFLDLTELIEAEGLNERLNPPSFSPWTHEGRVFGLPHDVHPVLLAYRADIVEEAGIDMSEIETWVDFERVLRPLIVDETGDGRPDRYLLNYWHSDRRMTEVFLLQAGSRLFDSKGRPLVNDPRNVELISQLILWTSGPNRIAIDARMFSAAGNRLLVEGNVVASLVPDWLIGVWKNDLPGLSGKMKIMPLPAWEPGGARTSVMGGTMLGIPKATEDIEAAWSFARELYLSPDLAEGLFRQLNIISPVVDYWDEPYYDEPDPYFGGQVVGRLYIEQAPNVPVRPSLPFNSMALAEVANAMFLASEEVEARGYTEPSQIQPFLQAELDRGQARVERQLERNAFYELPEEDAP